MSMMHVSLPQDELITSTEVSAVAGVALILAVAIIAFIVAVLRFG